ncbi:class I SAM-dependent methyltransferase [Pectobacterium zantedeschiae]|uniref:class I SAM-dependent methyltransferase n=1 Tax=Pectobacterium zantedeschiae TaxID=2034769 RepID=UPI001F5CF6EB|nr:SAM-dependent methyltransferase [Pectobacterium zantedeschiae]
MNKAQDLGTPMTDEQYAEHWGIESEKHNRLSDYSWMASFIPDNAMILDVGCGNGLGCIAMLKKGCSIIAIEANEFLAKQAIDNVRNAGFSTKLINLDSNSPQEIESGINFHILVGSLFSENSDNVAKSFSFDYVTNWLFGASPYRAAEEMKQKVEELDVAYASQYRERATVACQKLSKLSQNKDCKLNYTLRSYYEKGTPKEIVINTLAEEQNEIVFNSNIVNSENVRIRKNEAMSLPNASQMKYISSTPGVSVPRHIKPIIISVVV